MEGEKLYYYYYNYDKKALMINLEGCANSNYISEKIIPILDEYLYAHSISKGQREQLNPISEKRLEYFIELMAAAISQLKYTFDITKDDIFNMIRQIPYTVREIAVDYPSHFNYDYTKKLCNIHFNTSHYGIYSFEEQRFVKTYKNYNPRWITKGGGKLCRN